MVIKMEEIVSLLIKYNKTISCMESCTGGYLSNCITNIPDASKVFSFGAITYSNEYKVKLGVSEKVIEKYTVYSLETAEEMAKAICNYTISNYGIGITGTMKKKDNNNLSKRNDLVYYSIYDRDNNTFSSNKILLKYSSRSENKNQVVQEIINNLIKIIK